MVFSIPHVRRIIACCIQYIQAQILGYESRRYIALNTLRSLVAGWLTYVYKWVSQQVRWTKYIPPDSRQFYIPKLRPKVYGTPDFFPFKVLSHAQGDELLRPKEYMHPPVRYPYFFPFKFVLLLMRKAGMSCHTLLAFCIRKSLSSTGWHYADSFFGLNCQLLDFSHAEMPSLGFFPG